MFRRWHVYLSSVGHPLSPAHLIEVCRECDELPSSESLTSQDRQDAVVWHLLVRPITPGAMP